MTANSLVKGGNSALGQSSVALTVDPRGTSVDVSARLLDENKKVRSDSDLVFYNHPRQDGVHVSACTVTAVLDEIPKDVVSIIVVASADPHHPGTVFTAAPGVEINQTGLPAITFTPPDFTERETVVVLAELYRSNDTWKVRAVGQGYASGLAGLATDYGVDVEDDATTVSTPPTEKAGTPPLAASVSLEKVRSQAPALVGPARQAGVVLQRAGIAGRSAAIYLILAHDYGTEDLDESFAIQAFAERVLALSANLDDDGVVPVIFSGEREPFLEDTNLLNYRGRIGELHTQVDWGWGHLLEVMRRATNHYQSSGASDPAVIIVHVGEAPSDEAEIRSLLQNTASLGVFWLFVGFGKGKLAFFKNLNASTSAKVDNVAFYDAGRNPGSTRTRASTPAWSTGSLPG